MNVESGIYQILKSDTALISLIGTKVYAVVAPQNVVNPFVVFREINVEPSSTKSGVSRLDVCYINIDVYHNEQRGGTQITSFIRKALDRYSGTSGEVDIQSIEYLNSSTFYDYSSECFRTNSNYKVRQVIN